MRSSLMSFGWGLPWCHLLWKTYILTKTGGVHGVVVIVIENGHGDTNSNPGWGWLHFTYH